MTRLDRRGFLRTGAAAGAMVLGAPHIARASTYPERNIEVYIPTAEGGGADRNFRAPHPDACRRRAPSPGAGGQAVRSRRGCAQACQAGLQHPFQIGQ